MTREEHLLVILAEECSEVIKEVTKSLRFGLTDHHPKYPEKNIDRLTNELNDLLAIISMLEDDRIFKENTLHDTISIINKKEKVERYLKYSNELGRLTNE